MINAGIIGSTGYAGQELVRLLLEHKDVEIKWVTSNTYLNKTYNKAYGSYFRIFDQECISDNDFENLIDEIDVLFTATPHGLSAALINKEILQKVKVIDLSADFRLKDKDTYKVWYGLEHASPELLEEAVYGLSEINKVDIKKAQLIANPGCYPTCSTLSLFPLLKEDIIDETSIIIDAKSGVSGAGRANNVSSLYCEVNESTKAYGVAAHRHTPEIEEQMSYIANKDIKISFTPHLIPINRGMLTTSYATLKKKKTYNEIKELYEQYYKEEYFVRVLDEGVYPETRWVEGSNFIDINFKIDERTNRIIVISAIDNLVKGAAGQAVQNMNLMFGLPENTGLKQIPLFP
ncbi:MAG: N-acetyl-gamma-glutamyl-phosphate reductase, common form [Clostridiales bacterium]|jgi:N-acetyl-gamma-glutamyl-phosphate reductase|nr:N-acetyl-gamma-glutamyl-phosphate reductase, common form [Clostridiales bacterium]